MRLRILVVIVGLTLTHTLFAQQQPEEGFVSERADRKVNHYIGLQANQLIRQLLSFGGNSSAIVNPYLLTYSVNSKTTGVGFAAGLGYSSIKTKSTDVFVNTTSTVNDLALRVGIEKKSYLSKRWMAGFGADILAESNKAESETNTGNPSQNPKVTTTTSRFGFGPRVTLNWQFHDKILLGTEASFYFKWISQEQTSQNTGMNNQPKESLRSFAFTLPAVLFVSVKL